MILKDEHFTLSHFEGSLDFLLSLLKKEEIEIYDVSIQELIQQFIDQFKEPSEEFQRGTAFIEAVAYLVWLKSKTLLPSHEQPEGEEMSAEDPHFEIIHHLLDYCRFKQAAKELSSRQEKQQAYFFRGIHSPEWKKPMGIDHVSLDELSLLFKEMINRVDQTKTVIQEENWRVSDKIRSIKRMLQLESSFLLSELFSGEKSRVEMIVIFLAILELMKMGEIEAGREKTSGLLWIFRKQSEKNESNESSENKEKSK